MNPIYENVEGYFGSIDDLTLKMDLSCKFAPIFDEVGDINIFYLSNVGYFYEVYGFKNGISNMHNLKVNLEDVSNERYSYINFDKLDKDFPYDVYCYEPVNPEHLSCQSNNNCTLLPYVPSCRKAICGCFTLIGGEEPYCHIP